MPISMLRDKGGDVDNLTLQALHPDTVLISIRPAAAPDLGLG